MRYIKEAPRSLPLRPTGRYIKRVPKSLPLRPTGLANLGCAVAVLVHESGGQSELLHRLARGEVSLEEHINSGGEEIAKTVEANGATVGTAEISVSEHQKGADDT